MDCQRGIMPPVETCNSIHRGNACQPQVDNRKQRILLQMDQQQHDQLCKSKEKHFQNTHPAMSSYQFRIVMMPQRLQMRLALTPAACLASTAFVLLLLMTTAPVCQAGSRLLIHAFSGPVTGPEQKIIVHDALNSGGVGGGARIDFIAKPAYEFAYGVEDAQARLLQNRQETRDGDAVRGSYSVVDPDGNLRVVKYTADHVNGFQAEVTTNGLGTTVHGQQLLLQVPVQAAPTQTTPPLWYYPHVAQQQQQQQIQHDVEQKNEDSDDEYADDGKEVAEDYEESADEVVENKENLDEGEENEDEDEEKEEHDDYEGNEYSSEE
ncbi:unnamed protein product [Ceratitis capitata]|uniref:(Mediterranean fruit fly) hypothetical protein n=1 Tax=Ceratitis capitata TaxID=7213 RepID=A0A811UZF1_CERCA|nr:unnamed protein product [Ceratitis capitata]